MLIVVFFKISDESSSKLQTDENGNWLTKYKEETFLIIQVESN